MVSGVVAAYGGLTVVLSVVIRGETLTTVQAVGAAVATVGVILTGIAFEGGLRGTRFAGPGVAFAVVALVLFAAMSIVTDIALDTIDWLPLMLMARGVQRGPVGRDPGRRSPVAAGDRPSGRPTRPPGRDGEDRPGDRRRPPRSTSSA